MSLLSSDKLLLDVRGPQTETVLISRGHGALSGDIFGCHHWGGHVPLILWIEAGDAAKYPTMHKTDVL